MKSIYNYLILTLTLFLSANNILAQTIDYNVIFNTSEKRSIGEYHLFPELLTLEMPYAKTKIIDKADLADIHIKNIKQVHLIYTKYPQGISMEKLNRKRLHTLFRIAPELFNNPEIKWTIIDQTNCPDKVTARNLFHGFAFSYKEEGLFKKVIYQHNIDSVKKIFFSLPKSDRKYLSLGIDSLSYEVMARNSEKWGSVTIVSDWTASMYPYTTQILRWHLANHQSSNIKHFVFFNDGDKKAQSEKIIGNTGGIYSIKSEKITDVIELMKHVKLKGTGDDLPENDIEALICAKDSFPDTEGIVLIADNKSLIRDIELLEQVKKPVHIILGRVYKGKDIFINRLYIKIALATNGSLHTLTKDYYTKSELEELKNYIDSERARIKEAKKAKIKLAKGK